MNILRGQKVLLTGLKVNIKVNINAPFDFDLSLFGLDDKSKLSDDRYMIFYNQLKSPCNSVYMRDSNSFVAELNHIPISIKRLALTVTGDSADMSKIASGRVVINDGNTEFIYEFTGKDFSKEKAIILTEIYIKDSWRLTAVGQGFNGGLSAMLKHYGGEEIKEEPKISLVKKLSLEKPRLVNLGKAITNAVAVTNLQGLIARVVFILDASGSMRTQYCTGDVQLVVERVLMAALQFDDDVSAETYAFAEKQMQLSSLTLKNVDDYVSKDNKGWESWMSKLNASYNNEPVILRRLIDEYKDSKLPVYVIFISDGGIDKDIAISKLLVEASQYNMFIQIMGLGGSNYGILQKLADIPNLKSKNCSFFPVDNIKSISDDELYQKLLTPLSKWIKSKK